MVKRNQLQERLDKRLRPKAWYVQLLRVVIILFSNAVAIRVAVWLMPGVTLLSGTVGVLLLSTLIAFLNISIRPFLVRFTLPITIATLGLITLIINGSIMLLAAWLFPVIQLQTFGQAVILSTIVTLITWVFHVFLSIDDTESYFYSVVKKMGKERARQATRTDKPGFLYFEIDGLAAPILREALKKGYLPTLAELVGGSHVLSEWETDLPAQTCASQRGILNGNNWNIIGFRWYDRAKKKMITASNPKFVTMLEEEVSNGQGLLAKNGASIGNMFSGEAELTAFTTAASGMKKKNAYDPLSYYFVNPFNYIHTMALVFWEIWHEFRDQRLQEKENRQPRITRGWVAALQRAIMCIFVPDIAVQTAIGEMFAGRDAIYMTYAGYDELSHLGGLDRPEAMRGLERVDKYLYYLLLAMKEAPRPYHLVLLSDHGQSMGWTFEHTFKTTIGDVVKKATVPDTDVREVAGVDEVSIVVGDILTDIKNSLKSKFTINLFNKTMASTAPNAEEDGVIIMDKNARAEAQLSKSGFADIPEILVQVGGNLAMVYFTDAKEQLTLDEISARQPKLVVSLVAHPGFGMVLVKSSHGPVVFGKKGLHYLDWDGTGQDKIEGEDPVAVYGKNAVRHLLRVAAFETCPDVLMLSTYDPVTEEIIGFEPQCGAHGALGGPQNHPFLIYPKTLSKPTDHIIGAENLHKQLLHWQGR